MASTKNSILVLILFILWIVPGIVGRDLWKADEPYSFGLALNIAKTGELVVPLLAGEPFLEKPPLFYLTAAVLMQAFPGVEQHVAARTANVLFMLLTLAFLGLTARELFGKRYAAIAAIILMGSTGLQLTAHKLVTDIALLSGFSIALFGLALAKRRFAVGGLWLGVGVGMGFLSKGLLLPGIITVLAVLLPLFPEWRKKGYFYSLLIGFVAALPWFIIWPYALYQRSPSLFTEWFWYQNMGRFLGFAHVGRRFSAASYLTILPWFALPALPLGIFTLWKKRLSLQSLKSGLGFPLVVFIVIFVVLTLSSSIRDIYALPMLLPLSLLAAGSEDCLSQKARTRFTTVVNFLFAVLALVIWTAWFSMLLEYPEWIAFKMRALRPAYTPSVNGFLLASAGVYTIAWVFATGRFNRLGAHPAWGWTAGMTLVWTLLMTLWLPWLNAGSGYRDVFTSLRRSIPAGHVVVASQGIGESERALLEYYAGIVTHRVEEDTDTSDAELFLTENSCRPKPEQDWRLLWQSSGNNPRESYTLYQRINKTDRHKRALALSR